MIGFDHLHDIHKGETCIVIGNGPSLKDVPLGFLKKYPTFGANRITLLTQFLQLTYYVAINPLVIQQNSDEINRLDCEAKFIRHGMGFFDEYELRSMEAPLFSYNPSQYVYEGYTVSFVSLELAFFMGFTTALCVGIDHRYEFKGGPNEPQVMSGDDPNHFDPEYFKGQTWNNPDLAQSAAAYWMAKDAFESDGRQIINLTQNSALDVLPIGELEQWA